jgi:putative endonuclease
VKTKPHNQRLGQWGERLAEKHLLDKGYTISERNVRTPYGEIDLVAESGGVLVFVEVKARSSAMFGFPETGLTPAKRTHLLNAIQAYLQEHPEIENDWRVDVIAIQRLKGNPVPEVVHFENALD